MGDSFLSQFSHGMWIECKYLDQTHNQLRPLSEELKAFIAKVNDDHLIQEQLNPAKTAADVLGIAKEHGHEFTADRLTETLTDEELEGVAGGGYGPLVTNGGGPACANMCIQTNMLPTNRQVGPC